MSLSHKEKDLIIDELKAKLKEMKSLEKQVETDASELSQLALGVHKDAQGHFHLIKIKYDVEKGIAAIEQSQDLHTRDYAVALYKSKEHLVLNILKGGKL